MRAWIERLLGLDQSAELVTPPQSFQAFTLKANGRIDRIITELGIRPAFDPAAPPDPIPDGAQASALWDTGATKSVISAEVVKVLNLTPVGTTNMKHAGGVSTCPTYLVNFELPHKVGVAGVLVSEPPVPLDGFNAIIGMDVICLGDFSITNVGGKTWVSFRMPPGNAIDYVVDANRIQFAGVRPNDPCPCGSGKKFKKCHRP